MLTEYNKLVDHLVSTMKGNSMTNDVTNSKKDWDDFWYNSEDNMPKQTKHNYNELVDFQVQSMNKSSAPFDTEAYANYKQLVDKEREKIDTNNITESIYKLGYKIDTLLSRIISQLDTLIEEDYNKQSDRKVD